MTVPEWAIAGLTALGVCLAAVRIRLAVSGTDSLNNSVSAEGIDRPDVFAGGHRIFCLHRSIYMQIPAEAISPIVRPAAAMRIPGGFPSEVNRRNRR